MTAPATTPCTVLSPAPRRSRRPALAAAALAGLALAAGAATTHHTSSGPASDAGFVVRTAPGTSASVEAAVRSAGGSVTRQLPLISGFSARVPSRAVTRLRRTRGVLAVTPDGPVRLASVDPGLGYDPAADFGSLYDVTRVTKAQQAWRSGFTGKGVDIALIDSGVAPVRGLTSGNVVSGPDLSFESQDPTRTELDDFGHGTHMAGIIAGRDVASDPAGYTDPTHFTGMAPDSRLVSVKVASHDGATDVSQVIAAIDWVAQHAHDPGMSIRVLNLSFGTDSTQDARLDPLVHAAEAAWGRGIVVVVAGGNEGSDRRLLTDPAMSPQVLAVGAEDPAGTVGTGDDLVPAFGSRGSYRRHVDLVAPGVHVMSLDAPGSLIESTFPLARVGTRFLRGSGTSQATAVTSGAVALYLQKYPTATPAQVKRALMLGARPFPGATEMYRGAGALDVERALSLPPDPQAVDAPGGTGTGSLEASRGTDHVVDGGVPLTGERDIFGAPFSSSAWALQATAGTSWSGGTWNGGLWTGSGWTGLTWAGTAWAGTTWTGTSWAGRTWSGRTWSGRTWSGRTWSGRTWSGRTWSGSSWAGAAWQ